MLTHKRLTDVLAYNPKTGVFTWKERVANCIQVGDVAGADTNGYRQIRIDGVLYRSNRLAWFYVHGEWPKFTVDHKNGVTSDNRIKNLRDVSHGQNMHNQRTAHRNNLTGLLGVTPSGNKWVARIRVNGKSHYLGSFDLPHQASAAYQAAKRIHHPTAS